MSLGRAIQASTLAGLVLVATGCGTGQKYYWGEYQTLLFRMYDQPSEAPAERQIDVLTKNIDEARGSGKPVAPGIYAHRGYMHLQAGHGDQALADFGRERELYPESAVMMDRMVAGMTGKPKGGATLEGTPLENAPTKPATTVPPPTMPEKMPEKMPEASGTEAKPTAPTKAPKGPQPAKKAAPKRSMP